MNKKEIIILDEQVGREFLPFVRGPSRYIGGEVNQIKKDLTQCGLTVALCFPDIYEIGMSHTGLAIIYDILNTLDGVAAERVFAPWVDAEKILRDKKIPLFSLESKAALKSFDIVGFSLTNELCYTNVLNMLDLGGINIRSSARDENAPVVIAGGGMANCCEPMADFIDLFLLGEGENAVVELAELVKSGKQAGTPKKEILAKAAEKFDWAYVPSLYNSNPKKLNNAVVEDFENAPVPLKPIVPFTQAIHERISVEIMRGCPGRCRFCQASFCRRPIRYRSVERIVNIAKACYHATGFDSVGLLSLSTADYPDIEELIAKLNEYFRDKHVGLSVPSLRVDKQLKLLPALMTSVRKGGLTIAVEAASEKLRLILNKPLKDEDLFAAAESAYRAGWHRLKLYFMVGLPGETEEDIKRIVELSYQLAKLRSKVDGRMGEINVTVSWLVPKPHTPFCWLAQKPKAYFEQAKQLILDEKRRLRAKMVQFKFHNIDCSVLESAIGRGDRRLADVIEEAWKNGAKFDLWDEYFNPAVWQAAFEKFGLDIDTAAQKQFDTEEILPWEHLGGPDKKSLLTHFNDAMSKV
ncbi:MAG: TIGR03960 family B12-binding radical SAM protein [Phycisphaerae bacterium]|nr:TIGR03960 family B12-binding radical SAM protein [Phycisphaerae bacterium]MDD5381467.1 TIGR03960 family B12-binding radical SAM protein [Phycisphaerae bacterium]